MIIDELRGAIFSDLFHPKACLPHCLYAEEHEGMF